VKAAGSPAGRRPHLLAREWISDRWAQPAWSGGSGRRLSGRPGSRSRRRDSCRRCRRRPDAPLPRRAARTDRGSPGSIPRPKGGSSQPGSRPGQRQAAPPGKQGPFGQASSSGRRQGRAPGSHRRNESRRESGMALLAAAGSRRPTPAPASLSAFRGRWQPPISEERVFRNVGPSSSLYGRLA
jgi:hypothetical protein